MLGLSVLPGLKTSSFFSPEEAILRDKRRIQ